MLGRPSMTKAPSDQAALFEWYVTPQLADVELPGERVRQNGW
jgi:hypothetical protein